MPAFLKLGDIKGEATDTDHKEWILIETMQSGISRSIPEGAKDQQRTKGETSLSDIVVSRQVDKSSPKLWESVANGTFYKDVEVHFCTTVKNKQEPYMVYKLSDVIVSSYSASFNKDGSPLPMEMIAMGFTKSEWIYSTIDPKTGDKKGEVPAKYVPAEGRS
jgi:type VI secretion system secreted protein Hcp